MTSLIVIALALGGGWFGLARFAPSAAEAIKEAFVLLREPWVQAGIGVVVIFGAYAYGVHSGRGELSAVKSDVDAVRTALHCPAGPFRDCPASYTDALDKSAREAAEARDAEIDAKLKEFLGSQKLVESPHERTGGCVIDDGTAKLINGGHR
jgi:hypothetical protein